jgi:hypothetical protein
LLAEEATHRQTVDVFLRTNHRLAADGYQTTAGRHELSENAYRFAADDYQLATDHLYDDAPDGLQT